MFRWGFAPPPAPLDYTGLFDTFCSIFTHAWQPVKRMNACSSARPDPPLPGSSATGTRGWGRGGIKMRNVQSAYICTNTVKELSPYKSPVNIPPPTLI